MSPVIWQPDVALEEARRILDLADLCECGHPDSFHPHGYCTWKDGSESCRCDSHTPVPFVVTRKETK